MAQHGVPPLRPGTLCVFCCDCDFDVVLSDMDALHALLKALGTEKVSRLVSLLKSSATLIIAQHNTGLVHGPHLFLRIISIILLLHPRSLLRSHTRLL